MERWSDVIVTGNKRQSKRKGLFFTIWKRIMNPNKYFFYETTFWVSLKLFNWVLNFIRFSQTRDWHVDIHINMSMTQMFSDTDTLTTQMVSDIDTYWQKWLLTQTCQWHKWLVIQTHWRHKWLVIESHTDTSGYWNKHVNDTSG
jgi:hypothetical protein